MSPTIDVRLRKLEGTGDASDCLRCTMEALNAAAAGSDYERPQPCGHGSMTGARWRRMMRDLTRAEAEDAGGCDGIA